MLIDESSLLEDLKVNLARQRHGPSAHYTAAGDEDSSDNEHPVKALAVYGAHSPRAEAEDTGFEGFTRVSLRDNDELQRRIYEAQPPPSRSKSNLKGISY